MRIFNHPDDQADMHTCLKVPEILLSIFDFIEDTYVDGDEEDEFEHHRPTLAALASTCRAFHDPAISLLWETQNSLAPLVKVMPPDLWECDRTSYRHKIFFRRPVSEEDWDRFEHYSPKIRCLNIDNRVGVTIDVLVRLFAYRPIKRLLPRLCSCSIGIYQNSSFLEHIPALLGESLQRLSIDETDASAEQLNALQYLLQSIARCFHHLSHIALPYRARSIESLGPQVSLARLLNSFTALKSLVLHWSDVTPEVLRSLTNLKQLESLCLGSYRDDRELERFTERLGDIKAKGIFDGSAYLRTLKLRYAAAHHIQQILCACPKALQYVELTSMTREERFNQLVTTLGRFPQITYLYLDYRDSPMLFSDNEYPSLIPLLPLHHLREVFLIGLPSTVLTDQLLQDISKMWPDLHILDARPKEQETTQMTLEGLIPLAQSCNNLVSLTISVICRPFDLSRIPQRSNASHLQRLVLSSSPLEQPWKVLRCISHLFPKAISVKGSGPKGDDSWKDIKLEEAFS